MVDLDPDVISHDMHTKAFFLILRYEIVCRHGRTDTKKGILGGLLIYCSCVMMPPLKSLMNVVLYQFLVAVNFLNLY